MLIRNDSNDNVLNYTLSKLILGKLLTMISKPRSKQVLVHNTRTGKQYPIHPSMAKDPAWMAARGLIIQEEVKMFEVTNMEPPQTEETKTVTKNKTGK